MTRSEETSCNQHLSKVYLYFVYKYSLMVNQSVQDESLLSLSMISVIICAKIDGFSTKTSGLHEPYNSHFAETNACGLCNKIQLFVVYL